MVMKRSWEPMEMPSRVFVVALLSSFCDQFSCLEPSAIEGKIFSIIRFDLCVKVYARGYKVNMGANMRGN